MRAAMVMTAPDQQVMAPKVLSADHNTIELLVGDQVLGLLARPSFQQAWETLYRCCPWATVFQSPAFVTTWYQSYQAQYLPLILRGMNAGKLTGLLTLARKDNGLIVGAGDSQAEYQVWLAPDTPHDAFLGPALDLLHHHFPGHELRLKYLPALAPRKWLTRHKTWNRRCVLRPFPQPLLTLRPEQLSQELRKKNRREKLNRLRRLGELSLERVTDGAAFAAIFDELATQYDFRKGAMFNKLIFRDDPQRKPFLLALFDQGLLHVTVLKLNEEIIAANVGAAGRSWVHLQGLNMHAPAYARYSPGILHFLLMGQLLAEEGYTVFDLTPGADAYKQSLATDYVTAYELRIGNAYRQIASQIKYKLVRNIKSTASRMGLQPATGKNLKRKARLLQEKMHHNKARVLFAWFRGLLGPARQKTKYRIFCLGPTPLALPGGPALPLSQDSLPDLLRYDQLGAGPSRWEFLGEAMARLEAGDHPYTWSESGCLLTCAWLRSPAQASPDGPCDMLPAGAAVLQGFYCHPAARDRWPAFLKAAACAAGGGPNAVYARVRSADTALCRALLASGFRAAGPPEVARTRP